MLQPLRSLRLSAVSDRFLLQWSSWGSWRVPSGAEGEYVRLHNHVCDTDAISLSWVGDRQGGHSGQFIAQISSCLAFSHHLPLTPGSPHLL